MCVQQNKRPTCSPFEDACRFKILQRARFACFEFPSSHQVDMHSVHFHGQILLTMGQHTDTVSMFPGSSTTAQMTADNPGHWLLTCTVNDHLMGRRLFMTPLECLLRTLCTGLRLMPLRVVQVGCRLCLRSESVSPTSTSRGPLVRSDSTSSQLRKRSGTTLRQCLAMGQRMDMASAYAACQSGGGGTLSWLCVFLTLRREAEDFVTSGRDRIGSRYKKVRYVEYTDDTFMVKMLRSPAEQHLGILGEKNVA